MRAAAIAIALVIACGRSSGVPDKDLGGLVIAPRANAKIDVAAAATDPAALGAALALPAHEIAALLGPHATAIATATHVTEAGSAVEDLDDTTAIELGDGSAYHAVYSNSADYGREVTYVPARGSDAAQLYLRPKYQRWHARAPESPEEPAAILDDLAGAPFATWDLVAPWAAVSDGGAVEVAGRAGRKIEIRPATAQKPAPSEPLPQRKWRETRTIDGLTGEVVLDAATGAPLSLKLSGTVHFTRDGRAFAMAVSVQSDVSNLGKPAAIAVPEANDVVATPERLREVDDRDMLLQGIAPPARAIDKTKKEQR